MPKDKIFRFLKTFFVFVILFNFQTSTNSKPVPPGAGEGDVAANILFLVDSSLHILTIGQYLQPTKMHLEVDDFISPDIFEMYKEEGLKRGLKYVESGPLVRSSYHAERHVNVPI